MLVCLVLALVGAVLGDVKFPKDQSMKHRWPPLIYKHDGGRIPDGHLRPFGFQKKSDGKALEFPSMIKPEDFYDRCIKPGIPCVFQDVMNGTIPMEKWTDKYVESNWGHLNVSVERFLADKAKEKDKVTMKHFLRNYHHKEIFIRSTVLSQMEPDIALPPMLLCGTIHDSLTEEVLWASSGFTPSRMHYDSESQLHCLIDGRKDFVLYDPKYSDIFKFKETYKGSGAGYCPWNPEILSVYENPGLSKAGWKWVTLWPGDCLYLPQGYLHQVRAFGRSWSLSTHWIHSKSAEFDDCLAITEDSRQQLDKSSLFWTYVDGDKRIRADIITGENLKKYLLMLARASGRVSFLKFNNFVMEANENYKDFDTDGHVEDITEIISPRDMFDRLSDKKGTEEVSSERLSEASDELYEELATMVTPPHSHDVHKDEL